MTFDEELFEYLEQTILRTHLISVLVATLLTISYQCLIVSCLSEAYYLEIYFLFTWLFQQACNRIGTGKFLNFLVFLSFWVRCRSSFTQCLKKALILWQCLLAWNKNCYFVHTFPGILFYLHIKISMSSQYVENLKPMSLLVAETITKKYSNTGIIKSL